MVEYKSASSHPVGFKVVKRVIGRIKNDTPKRVSAIAYNNCRSLPISRQGEMDRKGIQVDELFAVRYDPDVLTAEIGERTFVAALFQEFRQPLFQSGDL
jgi:hypothetical protein